MVVVDEDEDEVVDYGSGVWSNKSQNRIKSASFVVMLSSAGNLQFACYLLFVRQTLTVSSFSASIAQPLSVIT